MVSSAWSLGVGAGAADIALDGDARLLRRKVRSRAKKRAETGRRRGTKAHGYTHT